LVDASVAASMTTSAPALASSAFAVVMRASASSRAEASMVPFLTCRSMLPAMVARPFSSAASATSIMMTGNPLSAATCAMPLPIWPAPTTAIFSLMRQAPGGALAAER
jgi:hypothetical protein